MRVLIFIRERSVANLRVPHLADYMLADQKCSVAMACVCAGWHAQPAGGCSWPQAEKIDNCLLDSTEQPGFDGVHGPSQEKGSLLYSVRMGTATSLAIN